MKKLLIFLAALSTVGTVVVVTSVKKPEVPVQVEPERPIVVPPKQKTLEEMLVEIAESDGEMFMKYLTSDELEGRMSGKRGNVEAAEFIEKAFRSYNLETSRQRVPIQRGVNQGPRQEVGDDFTHNIIGVLRGDSDSEIVIGAHFDHIGYGPSYARDRDIKIHAGADDNASGTTVVLQLAKQFSKIKPKHTIVFVCFSGEEMGLLGANYYVKNTDVKKIDLMINYDMVGRLRGTLEAIGAKKHTEFANILAGAAKKRSFQVEISGGDGGGGSDHAAFARVGVPVCFFHTGSHSDYHTIRDTYQRINMSGLNQVARLSFEVIYEFDRKVVGRLVNYNYDMDWSRDRVTFEKDE